MASITASGIRRFKLSKFILSWYGILLAYAIMIGIFLLLRMGDGNNPIALSLGALTFRWYGIIITCGVIVASFLAQFLAERRGDDPDHVWRILPVLLVFGIVFARFWYVFNTWEGYKDYFFSIGNPTHAGAIEIWRGGIAIQGAVVGGALGAFLYGYIYNRIQTQKGNPRRFSLWRFSDFVAPGLVLAQGIGRWGNFMNNEAYGRETKYFWGIKIPCEYRTSGNTPGTDNTLCPNSYLPNGQIQSTGIDKDALFHPTFFYESLWNYFTFLILFFCIMRPKTIERRFKVKLRDGDVFLLYWVIYSIGRFFTEGLRTDSLYFMGNTNSLRTAQVLAIISILVAGFLLFYRHRKSFPATQALSMRLAPVGLTPLTAGAVAAAGSSAAVIEPATTTTKSARVADNDAEEVEDELEVDPATGKVEPDKLEMSPVEAPEDQAAAPSTSSKPDYKARVRPAPLEKEPVSDELEDVTRPDSLETEPAAEPELEFKTTGDVPPPAVDTDPKPVDVDFEETEYAASDGEKVAPPKSTEEPEGQQ
jgi:phosphatidylglycerol---prolipoprotein diacylglyceryl transferase